MDRRKIKSNNAMLSRLGLKTTGRNDEQSGSQISMRTQSSTSSSFRQVIPSTKRKHERDNNNDDNDDNKSSQISIMLDSTSKKRRNDQSEENQESIHGNRPPSVLSDCASQSSIRTPSVMSKFLSMSKKNPEKSTSTSISKLPIIKSQEKSIPSQKTPVKNPSPKPTTSSVSPNTSEFERQLTQSDDEMSPVRQVLGIKESNESAKKRIERELTTPSKNGGSDSDQNIFSSGSSSSKKRGNFSLRTPNDKNNDNEESNSKKAKRRLLANDDDISPIRGNIFSSTRNDEVNKISSLFSPVRPVRNELEFLTPGPIQTRNKFIAFLADSRVTLIKGEAPHQINGDPNDIKINMKKLLQRGYNKEEISEGWKDFIDNDNNLKKATQDLKVIHDGQPFPSWYNTSLIKLLLQIAEIQKPLLEHLLQKLNEVILEATDAESVPWAFTIIQQIRFLEFIVDPESLTTKIRELIEATPVWFQKELIVFLPDIVIDSQHHEISEILLTLLERWPELINVILDTLSTFSFGKMQFEDLRSKLIDMLETADPNNVPAISRFILRNCNEERPAEEFLKILRTVHLEPLPNTKLEECYANQMETVQIIKQAMKAFKKVVHATANVLKTTYDEQKPMDIIYLLVLFDSGGSTQKIAESILKQHIRSGYYRLSSFKTFYREYVEVGRDLQSSALTLASNLVKSDDRVYAELGIEWFVLIFMSQTENYKQRQVLDKILQLVGYDNSTAKKAFTILSKMIDDDERRKYLHSHCHTLKILLEKVDNLDLESAAILSDVLHGLCIQSSSISESLSDDMSILMSKQIASSKPITKCKGVLSACMAIKHFASKEETCKDALNLFERVTLGIKLCRRSQALFYDRMSIVVSETENIDTEFLRVISSYFEDAFNEYIEANPSERDNMEVKFGLNPPRNMPTEIIISFGDGKFGGIVPILFRLIRMCNARLADNLNDINALLGAAIIVPRNLEEPESKNLDYMLYCINWFREVISGFISDEDSQMQRRILKRLDDLMKMQGEFQMALSMHDTRYEPPQAYFHYFPVKPFVKIEKKSTKKGKKADKSLVLANPEWETFDLGSLLVSKNPTYFRKLDIKVVHLLNIKMDMTLTQTSSQAVSIAQVCFVVKELLGMLENNTSDLLIRDLIHLLPEICNKLQDIANEVKENEIEDCQMREALILLLQLINQIFSCKELHNTAKHSELVQTGLSKIATQTRGMNTTQISRKDLVAEAYRFFDQMREIAEGRSIVLAFNISNVCGTLMKHSKVFENENKEAHATMAYDFLRSKNWLDKQTGSLYRNAIAGLLKTWIDNEPSPLKKVKEVVDWLKDDVELLEKASDCLRNLPSINKSNFPLLFKKILEGLIKGIKIDLRDSNLPCTTKLATWETAGKIVSTIVDISRLLNIRTILILSVRYLIIIMRLLLNQGIELMEYNLRYHPQEVMNIINYFQKSTRFLHGVYCTGVHQQDTTMTKFFPSIKSLYDQFICRMKGFMAFNDSLKFFKLGNLTKKGIDGVPIQSQSSTDESSSLVDLDGITDGTESNLSEILGEEELPDIESDTSDEEINVEDDNTNDSFL
ncbi:Fanconi anemia group D2 protein-like [Leptopilina boulardi]|uniref:Fanconi anemia group D2 protein-like n=1 Tax=Leptopilina boulardi TaxID=63433 RepID=UPI0021F5E5C1|nr:Fanconi anemia group D2 protein-like [Leptopilina boulardi]